MKVSILLLEQVHFQLQFELIASVYRIVTVSQLVNSLVIIVSAEVYRWSLEIFILDLDD